MVASDYFSLGGLNYLVLVDRYSNWPTVYLDKEGGAKELIRRVKEYMGTFGVMSDIASDGGSEYTSNEFREMCKVYGIYQRISSVSFPHSNQKAEGCVKLCKRIIRDNIGPSGNLNTDAFLATLLNFRNTPDRDTHLSPAQVIFGRQIRDFLPIKPGNLELHPEWRLTLEQREQALSRRHSRRRHDLLEYMRHQEPLKQGETVMVQNQVGNKPLRWDRTGVVTDIKAHDQYEVKMDGSGRLTLRNRRFLKPHSPYRQTLSGSIPEPIIREPPSETFGPEELTPNTPEDTPKPTIPPLPIETPMEEADACKDLKRPVRRKLTPKWMKDYHCNSFLSQGGREVVKQKVFH